MNNMWVFNDFEIPKKHVYSGLEFMFDAEPRFSFLWYFPEKGSQYLVHPYIFNVNISFQAQDISRLQKNTILFRVCSVIKFLVEYSPSGLSAQASTPWKRLLRNG